MTMQLLRSCVTALPLVKKWYLGTPVQRKRKSLFRFLKWLKNNFIGGVDLLDQFIAIYRVSMRTTKWW